ncbi:hypothetical protein D9615_008081 [Tricholomella constricta]|uniref:Uncharacterized protein n=1 Tax=Tricholomella constricta TaxID=117010 RepID=A0A8H5GVA6_9AGAR|nr:hypothetical protein D9615_008081 [Tricholomella constricta]
MSAFIAYDAQPSTTPYVRPNARYISSHPDEIPYANAIREIRSNMKNASPKRLHIYSFNIRADELESAHASLDKQQGRRLMRYMPNPAHEAAHVSWSAALNLALAQLTTTPHILPPGCRGMGSTTFQLGQRKKEGDSTFRPDDTLPGPSIVLEVGDSESLSQLKIDARLWLEHMPEADLRYASSSCCRLIPPFFPTRLFQELRFNYGEASPPPFPHTLERKPGKGAGNTVVQVITTDALGAPTTSILQTLPPGIPPITSPTLTPPTPPTTQIPPTTTTPTTTAVLQPDPTPPVQQGPVGQPDATRFTPGGVTPYTYTTIINGETSVLVDNFTPTNPATLPISIGASGTILDYSAWLAQYGPKSTTAVNAAPRDLRSTAAAWWSILAGVLLGAVAL